jgi:hypothetical protein
MGNTINKPLDTVITTDITTENIADNTIENITDTTTDNTIDEKLDNKNVIYDEKIKNYDDALLMSVIKFRRNDIKHEIGYREKRTFTITSFEKYDNLYYYYTNKVFFDCDYIKNIDVNTQGNAKIMMFIEIYEQIYGINDAERILTLNKYGNNIKFIFCTETPIVNPFCVSYDAYVASKISRTQLMTGRFYYNSIEYNNGTIFHILPYWKTKVNCVCRKFFKGENKIK